MRWGREPAALALVLLLAGCGHHYRAEPREGVVGHVWGEAPAEGAVRSDLDGAALHLARIDGYCKGCVAYAEDVTYEGLAATAHLIYHQDKLCAVALFVASDLKLPEAVRARHGAPSRTERDGPFASRYWLGRQVDVELRAGGYAMFGDPGDLLVYQYAPLVDELRAP